MHDLEFVANFECLWCWILVEASSVHEWLVADSQNCFQHVELKFPIKIGAEINVFGLELD